MIQLVGVIRAKWRPYFCILSAIHAEYTENLKLRAVVNATERDRLVSNAIKNRNVVLCFRLEIVTSVESCRCVCQYGYTQVLVDI